MVPIHDPWILWRVFRTAQPRLGFYPRIEIGFVKERHRNSMAIAMQVDHSMHRWLIQAIGPNLEHVSYIAHKSPWYRRRVHPFSCGIFHLKRAQLLVLVHYGKQAVVGVLPAAQLYRPVHLHPLQGCAGGGVCGVVVAGGSGQGRVVDDAHHPEGVARSMPCKVLFWQTQPQRNPSQQRRAEFGALLHVRLQSLFVAGDLRGPGVGAVQRALGHHLRAAFAEVLVQINRLVPVARVPALVPGDIRSKCLISTVSTPLAAAQRNLLLHNLWQCKPLP
mmetsp:Transcript_49510/g.92260  ORF Transcript_49510/g.92260 Transcript_49510/m.92260 type:complete len:276 (+) Transcript_49510:110-937(+)